MSSIAVLREPSAEQASRWYKPRKQPALARIQLLADLLQQDEGIRLFKRTDVGADVVIEMAGGATLRVTMRPEQIDVRPGPVLVGATMTLEEQAIYRSELANLLQLLQIGSGFYVFSDDLVGFEPVGDCPACHIEVFEWQEDCEACSEKLYPLRPGEDEHDAHAKRVVDALLRRKMIELVTARGRRNVERAISAFYAHGNAAVEVLLGILIDMPDVAEVYCDEMQLLHVLARVR